MRSKQEAPSGVLPKSRRKKVVFVADPARAPASSDVIYARPDDPADDGATWREQVARYNRTPDVNPFGLSRAYELYENQTYGELVRGFGLDNTMILSAGWGLITARFLTPRYDITFSASAESYVRRRKTEPYRDFCSLPTEAKGPIVFFGGKEYVPLFASLTAQLDHKIVFYNSASPPSAPGCSVRRFNTSTRTNWHYECARAFAAGSLDIS